jgi:hypothetical protein
MVIKMTQKIPYEIMAYQVELLYQKDFPPHDAAITAHCEFIAEFIKSCGWTEDEYFDRWIQEGDKIDPVPRKLNPNLS